MRTKKTTLSFLTKSKASHVSLSSIRRVAITLLVMLLTTASAIAQNYMLILDPNCDELMGTTIPVSSYSPTYKLSEKVEPTREGHDFIGWSETPTGQITYFTGDVVTLSGNLTLYAIWDDSPYPYKLIYSVTDEDLKQAELSGYKGDKPTGALDISSTAIINGTEYFVTSIGDYAFYRCFSLESVTIPTSVTWIGYAAFQDCFSLESVTIPNSVTSIDSYAFYNCSSLQSVTIPNSVTSIGNNAFQKCSSLQSVTIPNSVTSIGNSAFEYCSSLQSVTIPNSVTSIGNNAFQFCYDLQSVTIPNSVTGIGNNAFWNCYSLQSVTINGNPKIGTDAFWEIPATVTMNLTASKIDGDYWTTFYNDGYNFQADKYTKVYKGTVNESSLMLTEVEDKIVNCGTAVILKSTGNPVMTLTKSGSNDTNGNDLRGRSKRFSRISIIIDFKVNEIYTMGNTSVGFGFHRYTGEYVPAGKAFLPLNIENGAKPILTMVFANETTGINSLSSDDNALQNDWFSLDGTRLSGKPSQPGIYVNGKKKVVVK